jgi:hypothetical protein
MAVPTWSCSSEVWTYTDTPNKNGNGEWSKQQKLNVLKNSHWLYIRRWNYKRRKN